MVTAAARIGAEPKRGAIGVVLYATGAKPSGRAAPGPRLMRVLHRYRLAMLQIDLPALESVLPRHVEAAGARVGVFGAGSEAAVLLRVAAEQPGQVGAVVLCNSRPGQAGDWLARVQAPTLLIVGGAETELLALNRGAMAELHCNKRLEVVPGAMHPFSEPAALDAVAQLAGAWFARHLPPGPWG